MSAHAADTGMTFDLGIAARGEWQRVHVFSAYADRESAERELGFSWPGGDDAFSQRDGEYVLVFTRDREVTSTATVSPQVSCLQSPRGYPRTARFTARRVDGAIAILAPGQTYEDCLDDQDEAGR